MQEIEIRTSDPHLARYIELTIDFLKTDPIVNETINNMPAEARPGLFEIMVSDISDSFDAGLLPEIAAKKISTQMALAKADNEAMEKFASDFERLVVADSAFKRLVQMTDIVGAKFLALSLTHATLGYLKRGMSPEDASKEYLSVVRKLMDEREQEILLNMPIQGMH